MASKSDQDTTEGTGSGGGGGGRDIIPVAAAAFVGALLGAVIGSQFG